MASEEILPKRSRFPKPRRTVSIRASQRMLAGFVSGSLVFAAVAVAFMVFIDPLQFYHKSWYTPVFSNEQRYQNPGLARNYDYDTIILGSSMTENFLPTVVDEELGGKTLKLSIRGSYAQEQNDIAQVAFQTGKVKKVLWGLDYFALKPADLDAQGPYPHYLYDDKFWNDYKYWFNVTPYRELAEGLYKRSSATDNAKRLMSLEYLYNWNYYVVYGKKYAMKTYQKALTDEAGFGNNEEPLEVVQNNFATYVESVVKAHPETEFYIYYPPYSILRQAVWRDLNIPRYEQQLTMKKWMFERFKQYPNVKVYDFQSEAEWTFNLDLFKDLSHHNMNVNTWITRAIGADDAKYRVTDANVDQFVTDLREQVEDVAVNAAGDLLRVPVRLADAPSKPVTFSAKVLRGQTNELLVPGKEAASALGAEMTYDAASKTMTLVRGDRELVITAGRNEATLNGDAVTVRTPVEIVGGRSMVPFVFFAETLGWKTETTAPDTMTKAITIQP